MFPTALSQTIEQVVRVSCGFSIALYLLPRGIVWAAGGLAFGMLTGEVVGLLVIVLQYRLTNHPQPSNQEEKLALRRHTLARMWQLALPVTAGRLISTCQAALDAILIPNRLQNAGFTAHQATTLFGQLGGAGLTLINFPSVFTFALATSLVPAIAEVTADRPFQTIRVRSEEAIRVTIIFGLLCLVIIFYFAEPLTSFFKSTNIAPVLRILAIGGIFSYLQQTTTAILQGLGKAHLPMIHSIAALSIRIPLLYWLTGSPAWGLMGVAWAFIIGFAMVAILNIAAIVRHTGMQINLYRFGLQPLAASLGMLIAFRLFAPANGGHIVEYLEELVAGIIVYFVILALNRGITLEDFRRIFRR